MASGLHYRAVQCCTDHLIDGIAAHSPADIGSALLALNLIEPEEHSKLLLNKTPREHSTIIVRAVSDKVKSRPEKYYYEFIKFLEGRWNLLYLSKDIEKKLNELKAKENAEEAKSCILNFSAKELAEWMKEFYSWSEDDCDKLKKESITGRVLQNLNEDEMKNLEFNFGTRKSLLEVQEKIKAKETVPVVKENSVVVSTRTVLTEHHYGDIIEQLMPVKYDWKPIAVALGFKPYEIKDVEHTRDVDGNEIYTVISKWLQWGPPDKRGSTDVATLEALQAALDKTNHANIRLKL